MRNVRSAGEYAIVCVGALGAAAISLPSFDKKSFASWLTLALLTLTFLIFLGLSLASLRKRELGYTERVFKYPRGIEASGPHDRELNAKLEKKVSDTEGKIRNWMLQQLAASSSATIFTRDLSWAEPSDSVFDMSDKNFRIVACIADRPSEVQIEHLRAMGKTKGSAVYLLQVDTKARFTWFTTGTNEYVAVALPQGRRHVIRTTDNPKDPAYRLARAVLDAAQKPKMRLVPIDELDSLTSEAAH